MINFLGAPKCVQEKLSLGATAKKTKLLYNQIKPTLIEATSGRPLHYLSLSLYPIHCLRKCRHSVRPSPVVGQLEILGLERRRADGGRAHADRELGQEMRRGRGG